jgi:hypothetical protein
MLVLVPMEQVEQSVAARSKGQFSWLNRQCCPIDAACRRDPVRTELGNVSDA